jgi:Flp pilus assembly CpaF family ATPase
VKLSQRLKDVGHEAPPPGGAVAWRPGRPDPTASSAETLHEAPEAGDPLESLKSRVQDALFNRLGARLYDASLSDEQLRELVKRELNAVLEEEQLPLKADERQHIVNVVSDDVLGYGPMERFLNDPSVTEVMVNGVDSIYIEREGKLFETDARFTSDGQLRRVIERVVSKVGRRIDESSPMVDARLPDGSRVNAIIPPLAVDGPAVTVRKFAAGGYTIDNLISFRTLTPQISEFLSSGVRGKLNVLVSGGTGSGKTTLLNVLSSFIPNDERIVTIEDAVELRLLQDHVIRLEARPPNIEGRGQVTIRDLVRNSLRMRPDRIIVGEVRSGEALDMLQAMNTGHEGSLSTLHANTPRDALARLETMVLMAGLELPVRAIREQVASAIDLIVHTSRVRDGTRRITHIVEVDGMEGDIITLTELFLFDFNAGMDADGKFANTIHPTGMRPKFEDKLHDAGIQLDASMFGVDPLGWQQGGLAQ